MKNKHDIYCIDKVMAVIERKDLMEGFLKLRDKLKKEGIELEQVFSVDKIAFREGVLWITDTSAIAAKLADGQIPFLALLHDGSREEDFSMAGFAAEGLEELDGDYLDKVYRRCCRLPWRILETERCVVRETTEEDVDDFYEIYREPAITAYTEKLYPEVEQEKEYVRQYIDKIYSFYQFGVWTIVLKSTGEVIGRAGFSYREGYQHPELGFVVGLPWQGRGIAFEVCSAILAYGEENYDFEQMLALVEPENEISLRLCRKLGFTVEGTVSENGSSYFLLRRPFQNRQCC